MAHKSDTLLVNGVRTHLIRGGRGEPLVILPPELAPGRWFPYHDLLAARFRIFAPDHPGFGESERPAWLDDISDVVFHYLDLFDQLGLDQLSLIGTSLGGWIAAELAIVQPRRFRRLVLVGAGGLKVEGVERYDLFLHPLEETLRRLFHDPTRAAQLLPEGIGPDVIVRAYHDSTTLARLAWNPYFYNPKLEHRLARITAPTLVVWGAHDSFFPLAHGQRFAEIIPGARLEVVADCGHLVPLEQTQTFARLALDFLTATP